MPQNYGKTAFEIGQLYGPQLQPKPAPPPINWKQTGYNVLDALKGYLTGNILGEAPVEPLMRRRAQPRPDPGRSTARDAWIRGSEGGHRGGRSIWPECGLRRPGGRDGEPAPRSARRRRRCSSAPGPRRPTCRRTTGPSSSRRKGRTRPTSGKRRCGAGIPRGNWFTEVSRRGLELSSVRTSTGSALAKRSGPVASRASSRRSGLQDGMGQPAFLQAYPHMQDFTLGRHEPRAATYMASTGATSESVSIRTVRPGTVASTAAHEFQHAIQKARGLAERVESRPSP